MTAIEGFLPSARAHTLLGSRILIVADNRLVAGEITGALERAGATVIGPLSTVHHAIRAANCTVKLDGALLDVKIGDQTSWGLADKLLTRGVPIAFATGYEPRLWGERYASVPVFSKPPMLQMVVDWLAAKVAARTMAGAEYSVPSRHR